MQSHCISATSPLLPCQLVFSANTLSFLQREQKRPPLKFLQFLDHHITLLPYLTIAMAHVVEKKDSSPAITIYLSTSLDKMTRNWSMCSCSSQLSGIICTLRIPGPPLLVCGIRQFQVHCQGRACAKRPTASFHPL